MKRNMLETVFGAVVLVVAGFFLVFSYSTANVSSVDGYNVIAQFTTTGGLKTGADVTISGVKIGTVSAVNLNKDTYFADVTMSIANDIKLPDDTAAAIASESLLGGRYLGLEPGASDYYLSDGDRITITQAPVNLEQMLGKFIFNGASSASDNNANEPSASSSESNYQDSFANQDANDIP